MTDQSTESNPITPAEFAFKMRELYRYEKNNRYFDSESAHVSADNLMMELLIQLGYGDGVKVFARSSRWCS